ncbi:sn1-specific diacylglycerol lipase [Apostasia shenzhenica]|uniref:Sn1-specific diacylglycerol lipase n=1 Tax=Apostasia shenzhenica TaxID=1088818 RepID=A0A2I0BD40_9ASPA|nr:sn1-specific diacylglycerol lipase [Apostasia shenzhenica]
MATATMATAAGAAALLYYTLSKRLQTEKALGDKDDDNSGDESQNAPEKSRISRRPAQAPATWLETISTLSETLRFTYSETLGKWPIGDLAFGIKFLLKKQGNLDVASIYAGDECIQLKGQKITAELRDLLNLLTMCWHFSKKPFPLFLEVTCYSYEDVLLQEPKAGILKPAFTILIDRRKECILLLIRGTHSIRDTLTAVTGAIVPFHHTLVHKGGVSDLVLGYAHCGMVAAARWIAKLATPCLTKALHEYPDYQLKVVGHSLGGGTASLLTYILREHQEFASATCVSFAPAACMTWELAESGKHFITSVINGADLVPTFSAASVDDLRSEVTASAWLNDLRSQIEKTKILSTMYRSASALGSRLPSIARARARVADAGSILRPVSSGTQVVMKRARNVAQAAWTSQSIRISSWSCIGPRHRHNASTSISTLKLDGTGSSPSTTPSQTLISDGKTEILTAQIQDTEEDENDEDLLNHARSEEDNMTEAELWQQLEDEIYRSKEIEETDVSEEMREEEVAAAAEIAESNESDSLLPAPTTEVRRFFPPGRILHIVSFSNKDRSFEEVSENVDHGSQERKPDIGIFQTPRSLYGKLRLSQTMINDHYMPMYRRNIEKLISELEKEALVEECHHKDISLQAKEMLY